MLWGKLVTLRAVEPADYQLLWRWLNDPKVMWYWGRPGNTESLPEVSEREHAQSRRGDTKKFIIETKDGHPLGQIDYYELNWQARSAWVSILIGEEEYWGGGYGTDAMRALLRYLFDQLGLHRVTLTAHETNLRAIRSYKKNGFITEGTLRDWHYFDGKWINGVIMSVLEEDFREAVSETEPRH